MNGFILTEIQMQPGSGLVGASNNWLKLTVTFTIVVIDIF